jgi:hypothetical protein
MTLDAFLAVAGRVLPRREVPMDAAARAALTALHAGSTR